MNVFLVTSPLQYILALEAKFYFNCQNCLLVLVEQTTQHGIKQQEKLFSKNDWDFVIRVSRSHRSINIPQVIKKIKNRINNKIIEHFFYAEYNAWRTKVMIKNLPIIKEIYFDDGTLTLSEYNKYIFNKKSFYRPRLFQDLILRLQRCKPIGHLEQSNSLEIFTIFNLNTTTHKIHQNTLKYIKEHYGNPKLYNHEAPIGYIGQGAIGNKKRKSTSEYIQELESLAMKSKRKIIYFPHRTEPQEVRQALENNKLITYHQSEYPLEIELIDKNIELSAFVGSYSTVMFTCRLLYPEMPIYTVSNDYHDQKIRKELDRQLKAINVQKINRLDQI